MSLTDTAVGEEFCAYIADVTRREPEVLARLREETALMPSAHMQISPEQGQLLGLLVRAIRAKRTIEIGVYTGYSSISVALALPEDGQIVACDVSDEWTSMARRYWREAGVEQKIDLRLAPALETLEALLQNGGAGQFDFAFIDADKGNYANYYERCLQLLRSGGLIAVDNVLWHGKVIDGTADDETMAIRAFNEKLHADDRIWLSLLPVGDGLTLALKK